MRTDSRADGSQEDDRTQGIHDHVYDRCPSGVFDRVSTNKDSQKLHEYTES